VQANGKLALLRLAEGTKQHFGNAEAKHAIAQKLQPLVVAALAGPGAGMGDRPVEAVLVGEDVADQVLEGLAVGVVQRNGALHSTPLHRRSQRRFVGHFQISEKEVSLPSEKKIRLARPIRFSAGTKPTSKRLSAELSRLSPIMK